MNFFIDYTPELNADKIEPNHNIMLIGSCFTEHMGMRLEKFGWNILQNPTGVIYNPISIYVALDRAIHKKLVSEEELYFHDGVYHHWDFHSRYSHLEKDKAIQAMNQSIHEAHEFLKTADWLLITWGSAHYYTLIESKYEVSNCHRVPNKLFKKAMYSIDDMEFKMQTILKCLEEFNPKIKICQTVSPVRHIKDGIVENSRSKARLTELSFRLQDHNVHYFPAYEILMDQLRDYRFYDVDLVHPNYAATQYVWEKLVNSFFSEEAQDYLKKMIELNDAFQHKPRFAQTSAHKKFLEKYAKRSQEIKTEYPHVNIQKYIDYFTNPENDV